MSSTDRGSDPSRRGSPHVFIAAGEASGDLHSAHLVTALRARLPDATFVGFGGEKLEAAGVALREDLVENSVMGFGPVVRSLGGIFGTIARFEEELRSDPPDLLIIVDYPGLNWNLARLARRHGIPVVAYICPQVWAWAPWRLRRYAKRADLLLVILPFEEAIYSAVHPRVRYVGNPVFDHLGAIDRAREGNAPSGVEVDDDAKCLALLPGSRRQEVREIAGAQLRLAAALEARDPGWVPVISCQRPSLLPAIEAAVAAAPIEARIHSGSTHDLQRRADLAFVCSGTATLETAWFGTPMVVLYAASESERGLYASYGVAPHFALVNLCAGREVVPEVLFTPGDEEALLRKVRPFIDPAERRRVRGELERLREDRFVGGAAENAAVEIEKLVREGAAGREPVGR